MSRTKITIRLSDFINWYFGENNITSASQLAEILSSTDFLWNNNEDVFVTPETAAELLFGLLGKEIDFYYTRTPWDYEVFFRINNTEYCVTTTDIPMSDSES